MPTGTLKWFNPTKGYGFIQPDNGSSDVFVHISAVERAGLEDLAEGKKVTFVGESVSGQGGDPVDATVVVVGAISDTAASEEEVILQLHTEDWLSANLLALKQEAIERAQSLDSSLAYVTEKCAAVGRA